LFRIFVKKYVRIYGPYWKAREHNSEGGRGVALGVADLRALVSAYGPPANSAPTEEGLGPLAGARFLRPSWVGQAQEAAEPGLSLEGTRPNIFYLYVGPSR